MELSVLVHWFFASSSSKTLNNATRQIFGAAAWFADIGNCVRARVPKQ